MTPKREEDTAYLPELPMCDICQVILGIPDVTAKYDGATKEGPWAYMCERHFRTWGVGLGIGRGQRLKVMPVPPPDPAA